MALLLKQQCRFNGMYMANLILCLLTISSIAERDKELIKGEKKE